jgi:hypothetical protein
MSHPNLGVHEYLKPSSRAEGMLQVIVRVLYVHFVQYVPHCTYTVGFKYRYSAYQRFLKQFRILPIISEF